MNDRLMRRRACLGLAMGLVSDLALARHMGGVLAVDAPGASGAPIDDALGPRCKVLHDFNYTEGYWPRAGLVLGRGGRAYGTTEFGGAHGGGVVYCLDRAKEVTVIHEFAGAPDDGWIPDSALVAADDGHLYGVTPGGGAQGWGAAFRIRHDGRSEILHDFSRDGPEGTQPEGGLLFASDGHFYGTTTFGGADEGGAAYRLDKTGRVTPLWQFGKDGDPTLAAGLIEGADGRLYGTSAGGGASDAGTIYSLARDGSDHRVLHSFSFDGPDGREPAVAPTLARDGSLYGTTLSAGAHRQGTIWRLAPDGTLTVLHAFRNDENGFNPWSPLLEIRPGVFVGTATSSHLPDGPPDGPGVVYMIHSDGRFRRLHAFGGIVEGRRDGANPWGVLLPGPAGQLIGTCRSGGEFGFGTIWKLVPRGD